MTGATGMLGEPLLRAVASMPQFERVFVLAHHAAPSSVPRHVRVLRGDVSAGPGLGLHAEDSALLVSGVTAILHAAADTRFAASRHEASSANTEGTRNLLAFARRCPRLERVCALSTVYVAGRRTGTVREDELEHTAGFVNTYEHSKYEAERLLRALMSELPISVVRLSTVFGDSRSGETTRLGGIHHALRFYFHSLAPMIPGTEGSPVDLIALDYATSAVAHLLGAGFAAGRTFHVCAAEEALPLGRMLDLAMESFQRFRPSWRQRAIARPAIVDLPTFELFVRSVDETGDFALQSCTSVIRHFAPELAYPKVFDDAACRASLRGAGVERPVPGELFCHVLRRLVESNWRVTPAAVTVTV